MKYSCKMCDYQTDMATEHYDHLCSPAHEKKEYIMWFVGVLIHKYKTGLLHEYVGDIIIKLYKKENPQEQALWNVDIENGTFVVVKGQGTKKSGWQIDQNNEEIRDKIFKPLFESFKERMNEYTRVKLHITREELGTDRCTRKIKKMEILGKIQQCIKNDTLYNDIIRYISPHFYPDMDDDSDNDSNDDASTE